MQLHLVGPTPELDALILSARRGAKSGSYRLVVDEDLFAALDQIREALGSAGQSPARTVSTGGSSGSRLNPRQIQERLRQGRTVAEVAAEAGTTEAWIDRFALPILAERSQVLARAHDAFVTPARRDSSMLPLGAAVRRALLERDIELSDDEYDNLWKARKQQGTLWSVSIRFSVRGKPHNAEWLFDLASNSLSSGNRTATALGYVDPRGGPASKPEKSPGSKQPTLDAAIEVDDAS